jgi:NhaA family Na+:H+ antiporter
MMKFMGEMFVSKTTPGILLCLSALLAMIVANSPLHDDYVDILNQNFIIQVGGFIIDKPILLWINDGLMAIFFLLIGLEIKRELVEGHLSSKEMAILPAIAAIGGVIAPALIYSFINWNDPIAIKGWAIPAATDIAFALGVMMALGRRVPAALKVCLVAIAVIDDLIAVLVIAFFYTSDISLQYLIYAGMGLGLLILMNIRNVTNLIPYLLIGVVVWAFVLKSGLHPTLAGVALGLLIPIKSKNKHQEKPLMVMEHALYPWVNLAILPIFAFANAGISFAGVTFQTFIQPITMGIILGLFLGKQAGIMLITKLATIIGLCQLPKGVSWTQFYGMSLITGIGFTMSLFIGNLAFIGEEYAVEVRLGVIIGSLLSIITGILVLTSASKANKE